MSADGSGVGSRVDEEREGEGEGQKYTGTHLQSIVDREQEDVEISKFIPRRAAVASSATALRCFGVSGCGEDLSGVCHVAARKT